jgi:hypothetical protein
MSRTYWMSALWTVLSASLVVLLASGQLYAQGHKGAYFGAGGGWGSADANCTDCDSSEQRENSGVYYTKGGYGFSDRFQLGSEFNAWQQSHGFTEPGSTGSMSIKMYSLAATATFYPMPKGGFFVKGGGGLSIFSAQAHEGVVTASLDTAKGAGLIVGAGYDIPAGRHVAVTPAVNYWYGKPGDVKWQGLTIFSGWSQNVVDATIGIVIH